MGLAADTPADRVEQLILLSERLMKAVREEIDALDTKRYDDAARLSQEAAPLAALYRRETERAHKQPELIKAAPEARKRVLIQATEQLEAVLDEHAGKIGALRELTEGLVHAIADYVAGERSRLAGYGPGAQNADQYSRSAITLDAQA